MVRKRITAVVALTSASVVMLTACSDSPYYSQVDNKGQMIMDVPVVEAHLSDGRYLDCTDSYTYLNHYTLDCDWSHPRETSDPDMPRAGMFQVSRKNLTDGRVLDCISLYTYMSYTVDSCDWAHSRHLNIS